MIPGRRHPILKSPREIDRMRTAGRLVADVLDRLGEEVAPGVTTADLDAIAESMIRKAGGIPSFIGAPGAGGPYRHSICVSIDEEVVHGVPSPRRVEEGQIVSIDAGAIVDGWHGDAARSYVVGDVSPRVRALVEATREAMFAGIEAAQPGRHIADISDAIEKVANRGEFGVVRDYVGHGIGTEMHEDPSVPNYRGERLGHRLEPGLCLAIEPMFTLGGWRCEVKPDGWTVVTADGSLAAHWEHTIAITPDGPEVLTRNDGVGWRLPSGSGV